MRFYKLDIQGITLLHRLAVPVWAASDEGRLLYDTGANEAYIGDNAGFGKMWTSRNDGTGSGLDSDLLDGQEGSFYQNASNLNAGTIPSGRLTGTYNIDISGTADAAKYS